MSADGSGWGDLVPDVWLMIVDYLSTPDLVNLSQTCTTLRRYTELPHVWYNNLRRHRFLPKHYPHLLNSSAEVVRRQLINTARLDDAYNQSILVPVRTHAFLLEFQGVFQGLRWLPGGDWLVLLFHSRTLNPDRHSNIWLLKPDVSGGTSAPISAPVSATAQSEWCWLPMTEQDGPFLSSRGDNLLLLHAYTESVRTFGVYLLDTRTPSVKMMLTFKTSVFVRNYVAAGDYIAYGWTVAATDESGPKHLVRIMKLNEDYSAFSKDVTMEIDYPPGHAGKLRIKYDIRLSGNVPRLLFVSARFMAAYDIPVSCPFYAPGSIHRLRPVWKYIPSGGQVSFGRILRIFREGAVVTLYNGQVGYIYPALGSQGLQDFQITLIYPFLRHQQRGLPRPAVFDSQRIFWPLKLALLSSGVSKSNISYCSELPQLGTGPRPAMETAMLPSPCTEAKGECIVRRLPIDWGNPKPVAPCCHWANALLTGIKFTTAIAQDWDELSGRLCVRYKQDRSHISRRGWTETSMTVLIIHMV